MHVQLVCLALRACSVKPPAVPNPLHGAGTAVVYCCVQVYCCVRNTAVVYCCAVYIFCTRSLLLCLLVYEVFALFRNLHCFAAATTGVAVPTVTALVKCACVGLAGVVARTYNIMMVFAHHKESEWFLLHTCMYVLYLP